MKIQPRYNLWDYARKNLDLSWIVARAFKDESTGEIYFVNQFPLRFKEEGNFSVAYSDGRTETLDLTRHAFDPEVKFSRSLFSQTSSRRGETPYKRIDAMEPGYSEPDDFISHSQSSPSCTESEDEGQAHPHFS